MNGDLPPMPRSTSSVARLVLYYLLLAAAVLGALRLAPGLGALIAPPAVDVSPRTPGLLGGGAGPVGGLALGDQVALGFSGMIGALLLMAPVVWVYIITKQRQGYDQSVVQTMILLPIVVAGVMFVVTVSSEALALAFALAAIVAAVRFRNTLKDTKDTVYIFLAIGVGIAAGTQALALAALMSLVFNGVVLVLWRFNVGNLYADQASLSGELRPGEAIAVGDPRLLAALTPGQLEELANRAARLDAYVAARAADKKGKRFTGVVFVHARDPGAAQVAVEAVLEETAQRWKLAEIVPAPLAGHSTLEYLVRLEDDTAPGAVLDALQSRGVPYVLAAEFRSLEGLGKKGS